MRSTNRVISPDEYDAAARLHPALCPLVAVGDTRCGRRLLSDAGVDATKGFAAVDSDQCSEDSRMVEGFFKAARAVALRLRRLTKIPAAAASSAMLGRKKLKPVPEESESKFPVKGAGTFAAALDGHTQIKNTADSLSHLLFFTTPRLTP
jgi:hypothetical protein